MGIKDLEPYQFKKGNKLAKGHGRPKMSEEQKALALSTRTELKALMSKYMTYDLEQVLEALDDPKLPLIDKGILRNLLKAGEHGDLERMDWMTNHIYGKQAEKVDIKQSNHNINVRNLSTEDLLTLKEIAERSKKNGK